MGPAAPCTDGYPGGAHHLIGAHQALRVCGMKPASGIGIEARQALAKRHASQRAVQRQRLLPDRWRYVGKGRQSERQRAQVKTATANDNRNPPGRCRGLELRQRETAPAADGAPLRGVEKSVEPMRRARIVGNTWLRGQDLQVTIALQAVSVDNDPDKCLCQR